MNNECTDYQDVKEYWNDRAKSFGTSPQSTTMDYYMREKEINSIASIIESKKCNSVADFGCGNGFSTIELAKRFPNILFYGFDYSIEMIKNAHLLKEESKIKNIEFKVFDLTKDVSDKKFDLICTDRCLINLPDWHTQKLAIKKIYDSLSVDGIFVMIENFVEGHYKFNKLRVQFELPEIEVRDHNLFFEQHKFHKFAGQLFENYKFENISSLYYLVSRIVYSKICIESGKEPDYYDIHHKLASLLPNVGDYGPIYLYVLEKG